MGEKEGLLELKLLSRTLQSLGEFYSEVLGLEVEENPDGIRIQAGTTRIEFRPADPDSAQPVYHVAFNIPENKFAQAKDWLSLRTRLLSRQGKDEFDFRDWNAHAFYFKDPAGNILEMIARHNLDNATEGPFTTQDILYVSEIGIVVDDVPAAAADIQSQLGLPHYCAASQDFAPMGDEHGLLIVISRGRIWMPTSGDQAEAFPLEAVLLGDHAADLRLSKAVLRISDE